MTSAPKEADLHSYAMIKPKTTKKETRQEINSLVEEFIRSKGQIQQVDMGESGLVDGKYNTSHVGFSEPRKERTPLNHIVAAIQQRKESKHTTPNKKLNKRPKKKIIYDDFGEPLRWIWEE